MPSCCKAQLSPTACTAPRGGALWSTSARDGFAELSLCPAWCESLAVLVEAAVMSQGRTGPFMSQGRFGKPGSMEPKQKPLFPGGRGPLRPQGMLEDGSK